MEISKLEHHTVIKFLFRGGCTATVIHKCWVTVYSESSPNYCAKNRQLNEFKCGHRSLEGDPCFGQPSIPVNQLSVAAVQDGFGKVKSKGTRHCKRVTHFSYQRLFSVQKSEVSSLWNPVYRC